ncbi:LysR substrate-binding domain-containing protein, partial [Leisingera sp. F5]|uniref:LysR substrate-binding domain-containing protein n=1 Tax=Leisingera sp. F5 TaxID=1813816 RepID=UPI000A721B8A
FQAQYSLKIQEWVISGLFEIGICEMPLVHDGLEVHPITVETRLAIPADSPLAEHEVLTPELLDGVPFIVMGPEHMTHRRTREVFQQAGVPLKTRVHSHLFKNLLSFVQEGMGVSVLDPFVLDFEAGGGFVSRPFRPRIMMEMAVVTSKSRPLSAVGQDFLALLKQELAPYTAGTA